MHYDTNLAYFPLWENMDGLLFHELLKNNNALVLVFVNGITYEL